MIKAENVSRRIDVLAIGLFGLAVGALTVGTAQTGGIREEDKAGVLIIALVFGGLVQILAGIADIRYNEQLGGTALTMYGFFWFTVSIAQLISESTTFHFDSALFVPINLVYFFFSAVMVYLTAYRSVVLSLLHAIITLTFLSIVGMRLNVISEAVPGLAHLAVGTVAFYHAIGSLAQAYTGRAIVPLRPPLLRREHGGASTRNRHGRMEESKSPLTGLAGPLRCHHTAPRHGHRLMRHDSSLKVRRERFHHLSDNSRPFNTTDARHRSDCGAEVSRILRHR